MQLKNIVRITLLILIALSVFSLLVILYTGGNLKFAGINDRVQPATAVIVLCVLIFVSTLLKRNESYNIVLLLCLILIAYSANYRTGGPSDTVPARYLPFSLWRECDFDLDEFAKLHSRAEVSGLIKSEAHYLSSYPVGAAIFALPYYLPSVLGKVPGNSWIAYDLEKLSASCTVLLSVFLLYLTVRRLSSQNIALMIAAIYAVATSSFSISSQALWQHGASQLCLTAALYCLVRGTKEPLWLAFSGFAASAAVICRPTDALLIIPMGLYVLFHRTRMFPSFFLSGIPPVLFQLVYNKIYFDDFFRTQWDVAQGSFWSTPFFEGLASILFTPSRGLLIYSPIFIFSLIGIILCWRKDGNLLFRYLGVGVIANLFLYSKFFMWWGGYTYGPRLLADLAPILCSFLVFAIPALKRRSVKIAFLVLVVWSFTAHAIGAYADDPFWNSEMDIDWNPAAAWQWRDNQLINAPHRAIIAMQIRFLNKPTTRAHPQLFGAEIKSDLPALIEIKPSQEIPLKIDAINTGSAVWNYGRFRESGNVGLTLKWYRREALMDRFTVQRRLRYPVFPGDSYGFFAKTEVPDREGRFTMEIAIVLTQNNSVIVGATKRVPVKISQ